MRQVFALVDTHGQRHAYRRMPASSEWSSTQIRLVHGIPGPSSSADMHMKRERKIERYGEVHMLSSHQRKHHNATHNTTIP
jgi:hypothetical protein